MTVSNATNTWSYAGNGSQTIFPYADQLIYQESDIKVYLQDVYGALILQLLDVDYTLSSVGHFNGGNVIFTAAPASGETVVIKIELPLTQELELPEAGRLPTGPLEIALDRGIKIDQQLQEQLDRSLHFPVGSQSVSELPAAAPGNVLGWDALGANLTNFPTAPEVTQITGISQYDDSLAQAVVTIGAGAKTLLVNRAISVTADLEVPETLQVWVNREGRITVDGCDLTLHCTAPGGLTHIFNCINGGVVHLPYGKTVPEWFGGGQDPDTDDAQAFASAWASIDRGTMILLGKDYKTSGSLTIKSDCAVVGEGIGITNVTYSGSDYWLKVPASTSTPNFSWQGMTVTCSGAALGVMQHQTTSQAYDAAKFSENWKIADLKLIGNNTAGSVGLSLTQLGNSFLSNIKVHEFATNILCDRTTDNTYIKVRTITSSSLSNAIGWEWRAGDTISAGGTLQEYAYGIDVELLHTGAVGIKVDAGNIHLTDIFYEKAITTSNGKCFLWLTNNCTGAFVHNGARYALSNGTLTNLILTDDSASIYQRGTFVDNVVFGSPAVTCTFGTSGVDFPWQFISPNESLYELLKPAIAAKKVAIVGSRNNTIIRTPGACANLATPISIPDTTSTAVTFDGEVWDSDTMIGIIAHPTRVTIVTPGIYAVTSYTAWPSNATGVRWAWVQRSGAELITGLELPGSAVSLHGTAISTSAIVSLVAGDYLELQVGQTSGGALNLNAARLAVQRISSAD
jgi:hypothetical protein